MNLYKSTLLFSSERLLRTALGFVVSILITKAYGIEVYGEYAYYFAIVNILGVALSLGLDDYFIKCASEGRKIPIKLLHLRLLLSGMAFIFCCSILFWKNAKFDFWLISLLTLTYLWNCFYLLLIVLTKVDKRKSILILISISLLFILIKCLAVNFGFYIFIAITVVETLTTTLVLYVKIKNVFEYIKVPALELKNIIRLSVPVGISSLSVMLFYRLDQMIVEHFLGVKVLGVYALSASMILAAGYIQSAYVTSLYPSIGIAKNNGNKKELEIAMLRAFRGAIFIGVLVYLSYMFIGRMIIHFIFPDISSNLISILNVGMISVLFSGLAALNSQYLFFYDQANRRLFRTVISLVFNIIWNIFLIPRMGIMAAIWGYVLTQVIMGVLANIIDSKTRILFFLQIKSLFPAKV